jgi:hypothetical protein
MDRIPLSIVLALLACSPAMAQNYQPSLVIPVDCSKAIATTNVAVTLLTAGQAPHGFRIQNIDTSEPVWFSFTGTAVAAALGSFVLPPGAVTTFVGAGTFEPGYGFGTGSALSAVATTVAHKISCSYW